MTDFVPQELSAWAKLTVSLHITGIRNDGYHFIEAEMVTIDLHDQLLVGPGDTLVVHETTGLSVSSGDDNLVRRALALVGRQARVELHKFIPAGAGLGGGSADAAAILRWAEFRDLEAAATLGADVPFCMVGGRAQVSGVGETIKPLPFEERVYTLLIPPFGCSTPAVYAAWDALGGPAGATNDLEAAALHVEPRLAHWRDQLRDATGKTPVLAGSGSTWFVEGAYPGDGRVVVRTVQP